MYFHSLKGLALVGMFEVGDELGMQMSARIDAPSSRIDTPAEASAETKET